MWLVTSTMVVVLLTITIVDAYWRPYRSITASTILKMVIFTLRVGCTTLPTSATFNHTRTTSTLFQSRMVLKSSVFTKMQILATRSRSRTTQSPLCFQFSPESHQVQVEWPLTRLCWPSASNWAKRCLSTSWERMERKNNSRQPMAYYLHCPLCWCKKWRSSTGCSK